MRRRALMLWATVGLGLATTACSGNSGPGTLSVTTEKLQAMVAKRFPREYPVAGLLQLRLQAPRLTMLPEQNAINAVLDADLAGKVLKEHYKGNLNLDFALRYEPTDRSLRAYQIKLRGLQMDGLPPGLGEMLATYASTVAEQALAQVVLYQLQDSDLALLDSLSMEPGPITVTPQGLTVALVPKPAVPK